MERFLARPMPHSSSTRYIYPPNFLQKFASTLGDLPDTWFLGPTRPTTPNGILIKSAVFPQYMLVRLITNGPTNKQTNKTTTELDR